MVAEVIVDILNNELDKVFDYNNSMELPEGYRVSVPFGSRIIEGYIIANKNESLHNLKDIISPLDEFPAIIPEMLELMRFMTHKYHIRIVDALRLFIPNKLRGGKVKEKFENLAFINPQISFDDAIKNVRKGASAQIGLLTMLAEFGKVKVSVLNEKFGGALKPLIGKEIVHIESISHNRVPYKDDINIDKDVTLHPQQERALEDIINGTSHTYLIHGVTGSGKTEVYMHAISHFADLGKTAIMLVPEISLTPQILRLFRARFGENIAILHSGLSDGERHDEWRRIIDGEARIVVGARSAIFAPIKDIGIIIVDEEHDGSYISSSNPRYNTQDIAEFRRSYNNCKLILGSATPSIATYRDALSGDHKLINMPDRVNGRNLPNIEIVDMCKELRAGNTGVFSSVLQAELKECIKSNHQAILFINRRGYASFMMCKECGFVPKCTDCDVTLTYHSTENLLKCHYCGKRYKVLDLCPECGSKSIRQGKIGTERVVEVLEEMFPKVNILRMDNDTVSGKDAHNKILTEFKERKAQILVGTQMIAKGHDFPAVTLVGIIDADLSLYLSDYRSTERTFQLITQVAGRAGRDEAIGRVVLQTYAPKHYVFRYATSYDYKGFYAKENNTREVSKFPPYSLIIRLLVSNGGEDIAMKVARELYYKVRDIEKAKPNAFIFLNAMKAPVKKIQKRFRFQIIMRLVPSGSEKILQDIYAAVDACGNKNTNIFVEINPTNLN